MKEKIHKESDKIVESVDRSDTWETVGLSSLVWGYVLILRVSVVHIDPGKFAS